MSLSEIPNFFKASEIYDKTKEKEKKVKQCLVCGPVPACSVGVPLLNAPLALQHSLPAPPMAVPVHSCTSLLCTKPWLLGYAHNHLCPDPQVTFQVIICTPTVISLRAAQLLSYASASLTAPVSPAPRAVLCRNMMSSFVSCDCVHGDSAAVLTAFYKLYNQQWFNSATGFLTFPLIILARGS